MGAELIISTLAGAKASKKITPDELKKLGYKFTSKRIGLGKVEEKEASYIINEVIQDDEFEKPAGFCYLYSIRNQTGIILSNTFKYFHKIIFPNGEVED